MEIFLVIIIAVLVDAYAGDEHLLWRKVPHPIIYIGRYINFLDIEFNRKEFSDKSKFFNGFLVIFISVIGLYFLTRILEDLLLNNTFGYIILGFLVSILLSGKSLFSHVKSIYDDLMRDDIQSAKSNLSKIVSRDVDKLDESSITRGSIESLSENFCDGYISPIFWFLVLGFPGVVIYKFISTADSMIGYKNEKYIKFGKCAAKIDDIMNFVPARISSLFIVLATYLLKENWKSAIQITKIDAKKSSSPNSGWPESSMAGALDIALGGSNYYENKFVNSEWINASAAKEIDSDHIIRALWIYTFSIIIFIITLFIFLLLIGLIF